LDNIGFNLAERIAIGFSYIVGGFGIILIGSDLFIPYVLKWAMDRVEERAVNANSKSIA